MHPLLDVDEEDLLLDASAARSVGASLASHYQSASPYPHICVDDFLPLQILNRVRSEVLRMGGRDAQYTSATEKRKSSINPGEMSHYARSVFGLLNSPAFLGFLEAMTGIDHLIPDPYFEGAGIHRTESGGFLGVHADFNLHRDLQLERRLNVLIYLNPDWRMDYGGEFEVWDTAMKKRCAAFEPLHLSRLKE